MAGECSNERLGSIKGGISCVVDHLTSWGVRYMGIVKQNIIQIDNMDSTRQFHVCPVIISVRVWRNAHWAVKVAGDEGFALLSVIDNWEYVAEFMYSENIMNYMFSGET